MFLNFGVQLQWRNTQRTDLRTTVTPSGGSETVYRTYSRIADSEGMGDVPHHAPVSHSYIDTNMAAGTYTIKVQLRNASGSNTGYENNYGSSTSSLTVMELFH